MMETNKKTAVPSHPDIQHLVNAAMFLIDKTTNGGEIYFQYKPGEKGKLDIKTYGYTTGSLTRL